MCTNWWVINIIWSTDGVDVWANRRGYYCLSFKWQLSVPKHTLTFIQLTLGTSVGLMFNQVHLGSADNLVLLLIILVICLAIQFVVSFLWFHRHIGWTKEEAMLGAVPGAMAAILALTDHTKTPPQKLLFLILFV